jgi:hypothetical protein
MRPGGRIAGDHSAVSSASFQEISFDLSPGVAERVPRIAQLILQRELTLPALDLHIPMFFHLERIALQGPTLRTCQISSDPCSVLRACGQVKQPHQNQYQHYRWCHATEI